MEIKYMFPVKKKKLKETIGIINSVFIYKQLFLFGRLENH